MNLKTKFFMPLLVILLMGMTTTAFAQMTCSVSSTPVSRATRTGHTELAGDLTFACTEIAGTTNDARITIDFGAPITNDTDYPPGGGIAITDATGHFTTAAIDDINYEDGQIILTVPGQATTAGETSAFTLTNVLVSIASLGPTVDELIAEVSVSSGDNISIVANQDEATVISSIADGLGDVELDEGPARWLAPGTPVTPDTAGFSIEVEEGYIDMFRNEAQGPPGATNSVMLAFEFSDIPEGAEIECAAALTGGDYGFAGDNALALPVGTDPEDLGGAGEAGTVDADDDTLFVGFDDPTDLDEVETVTLFCGIDAEFDLDDDGDIDAADLTIASGGFAVGDASLPLLGDISVRVTLAPTGDALDDGDPIEDVDDGGFVPRYEEDFTDELIVLNFTPATTTFLVPLAMGTPAVPAPFGSYDTGIAIANTTADPFDDDEGGAFAQEGTITFYFFPTTGDPFTITPEQLAGSCGLDAAGELASGRTFLCNTSEILREGGRTTAFTGYIFIVANFTNGHGTAFIYGGTPQERFTSATDVLVINPPAVVARIANPEPTFK
jgi:hypothetical protein